MTLRPFMVGAMLLAACAPSAPEAAGRATNVSSASPTTQAPLAITPADLFGTWLIASIDGVTPIGVREDAERERTPRLRFGRDGYGGTSGCNFFGGLGLLEGGRYYAGAGTQTEMGCDGPLGRQEQAIGALLAAAPTLAADGKGRLLLRGGGHHLTLRRDPVTDIQPELDELPPLAGTSWNIDTIDGRSPTPRSPNVRWPLRFDADRWRARLACGTLTGNWSGQGERIEVTSIVTSKPPCPPDVAAFDGALAALLRAQPRFVAGANGELMIAGGGHWLTAEADRERAAGDLPDVAGSWAIIAIDGSTPKTQPGGEPPVLDFGAGAYGGGTGCNSILGQYLAHSGRLFTAPGPTTQRGCGALTTQETRIYALLRAAPRIARIGEGVALVDERGRLSLRRTGPPRGKPVTSGFALPLSYRGELISLDGQPLRPHYTDPETRFRLVGTSWEADVGCGRIGGNLRRRDGRIEFFTDADTVSEPRCPPACARRHRMLIRMMNGPARATMDANGELLIAGDNHWLTTRVDRSRPRQKAGKAGVPRG